MNRAIIKEEDLKELKDLSKQIEEIELDIVVFGGSDYKNYNLRDLVKKITDKINNL